MAASTPPLSQTDIAHLRAQEFPTASRVTYFNHASDSPMPRRAGDVMRQRIELLENPQATVPARETYLAHAQIALGRLLGGKSEQIAFLTNVADATATVTNGIDWHDGDEVVVLAGEFASFVYPWKAIERRGARVKVVPKRGVATDLDAVAAAVGPRTRVVAVSQVEYLSGYQNDLAALSEIAHKRGALFVVDASQALGAIPVDVVANGVDVAVSVGYKWLMSPHGVSVLYVAPEAMERITPTMVGRYSVQAGWETDDYPLEWYPDARRYQGGALNWIGVCALAESAGLLDEIGLATVAASGAAVSDAVLSGLHDRKIAVTSDLTPTRRSSILTFTFGSAEIDDAFVAHAAASGVILGRRAFGVRFGAHFWNDEADVAQLMAAIDSFPGGSV